MRANAACPFIRDVGGPRSLRASWNDPRPRIEGARPVGRRVADVSAHLGQHLLVDERAIARIVHAAALRSGDRVLDAGAGKGALTRPLAAAVGSHGRVHAVELDPGMLATLRAHVPPQVRVIEGDLMHVPLPEELDAVVANPPFRIAAPLVERIVAARVPRAVLVLPRELVDRILAAPGSERYGKLTVRVALLARADDIGYLTRHAFDPPPEIVCGIVRLRARRDAPDVDPDVLRQVLDVAWEGWAKKAKSALGPLSRTFHADGAALTRLLVEGGWAERPTSSLPPEAFAAVARYLREHGRART